jgi:hypothetical protein
MIFQSVIVLPCTPEPGRCFCCQDILNLHEALDSKAGRSGEEAVVLRLDKRFWQRMGGPDGKHERHKAREVVKWPNVSG